MATATFGRYSTAFLVHSSLFRLRIDSFSFDSNMEQHHPFETQLGSEDDVNRKSGVDFDDEE